MQQFNSQVHRRIFIKDLHAPFPAPESSLARGANSSNQGFNVQVMGTVLKIFQVDNKAFGIDRLRKESSSLSLSRNSDTERQISHLILDDSTGICRIDFLHGLESSHQPYYNKPKPCLGDAMEIIGRCLPSSNCIKTIQCIGYDILDDPLSELVWLIETFKFNQSLSNICQPVEIVDLTSTTNTRTRDLIADAKDILDDIDDLDDLFDDME